MKKLLIKISFFALASLLVFACKKKSDSPAPSPTIVAQVTINTKAYTATTQVLAPTDSAVYSGTFDPAIASTGSYLAYTSSRIDNSTKIYELFFYQANIPSSGDTIAAGLFIESTSPITTGTYSLYGTSNLPNATTLGVVTYNDSNGNYSDSLASGSIVITQLDMANKKMSGTYSYTASGTKGSSPATLTVTNGSFTNIAIQEF
jgi:hypothetical protein